MVYLEGKRFRKGVGNRLFCTLFHHEEHGGHEVAQAGGAQSFAPGFGGKGLPPSREVNFVRTGQRPSLHLIPPLFDDDQRRQILGDDDCVADIANCGIRGLIVHGCESAGQRGARREEGDGFFAERAGEGQFEVTAKF